jgi:hypothetical protein
MQGCLLGKILRTAITAKRDYDCRVERFQLLINDVGEKHGNHGIVVYLEDSKKILDAMNANNATDEDFLKIYDDTVTNMIVLLDELKYDDAYSLLLSMLTGLKANYSLT